jgi:hypothetical protein
MVDDQLDVPMDIGRDRIDRTERELEMSGVERLLVLDNMARTLSVAEDVLPSRTRLPIIQNPPEANVVRPTPHRRRCIAADTG